MTLRVGLIGRGMAGTVFHAPLIRAAAGLELVAMAGSADAPDLIADPGLDLIVIATPNRTHFPLAEAALMAGKHVVVDKPLTVTVAEADRLIARAAERGRKLTVFHNRRWDGDFLTVRDVLASGRLGEVMLFEAHWDRLRPAIKQGWREVPADGAGLLNDLGPHMLDQALLLFGMPEAVSADIAVQRAEAAVDDYFDVTLHYGRRRVRLCASTLVAAPRPRFALHGAAGSFVKYGLDPQEAALKDGAAPGDAGFGADNPESYGTLTLSDGTSERVPTEAGRYLSFYETVAKGEVPVPAEDGRATLHLIELARQSADQARTIRLT
jgi:scyllo-inositol 2-dehydrogenase (NADP+)